MRRSRCSGIKNKSPSTGAGYWPDPRHDYVLRIAHFIVGTCGTSTPEPSLNWPRLRAAEHTANIQGKNAQDTHRSQVIGEMAFKLGKAHERASGAEQRGALSRRGALVADLESS
jgi:hypothetical protein